MKFFIIVSLFITFFNSFALSQSILCSITDCGQRPACNGTLTCQRQSLASCQWNCATSTVLNCTNQCNNISAPCPNAMCNLQYSTMTSQPVCAWSCPNSIDCTNYCRAATCPNGTDLTYCGVGSNGACTASCAVSQCHNNCNSLSTCNSNAFTICTVSNRSTANQTICDAVCLSTQCDACSPGCTPLCYGTPRCIESKCVASVPGDTSSCSWQNVRSTCTQAPISNTCQCSSTAPCSLAVCERNGTGCAWNDVYCKRDCSLAAHTACIGYNSSTCRETGVCLKSADGNCYWRCPVDPCTNVNGSPKCDNVVPIFSKFPRCLSQVTMCVLSNGANSSCTWSPRCLLWNTSSIVCTNSSCSGMNPTVPPNCSNPQFSCGQLGGYGDCQWIIACEPLSFDIPCLASDCSANSPVSLDAQSSACLREQSIARCFRDTTGRCAWLRTCPKLIPKINCVPNACQDICYNKAYLDSNSALTPPAGFSIAQATVPYSNCSYSCANSCKGLRICSVGPSSETCGWTETPEYYQCLQRCNVPVNSNSTLDICTRKDACNCDYTNCKFVVNLVGPSRSGTCLPHNIAALRINNDPERTFYYNYIPDYCLIPNATAPDYKRKIIDRAATVTANEILVDLIQRADQMRNESAIRNYYPSITTVSVGTPSPVSANEITFIVYFSLHGDTTPNAAEVTIWCKAIQSSFSNQTNLILSYFTCSTFVSTQKRDLQQSTGNDYQGVGVYSVPDVTPSPSPSTFNPTPNAINPSYEPTPEAINPTYEPTSGAFNPTYEPTPEAINPTYEPTPEAINPNSGPTPIYVPPSINPGLPPPGGNGATRMSIFGLLILSTLVYIF